MLSEASGEDETAADKVERRSRKMEEDAWKAR
jgi:hypothetical protein